MHSQDNKLIDYIKVYDDIIPESLADLILTESKKSKEWHQSKIGTEGRIDLEYRVVNELLLSKENSAIDQAMCECAFTVLKKYIEEHPQPSTAFQDSGYVLLKYKKGGFYKEHTDYHPGAAGSNRAISCSFVINDNFSGGEFSFFGNTLTYSLKKGSAILFPSNFMFPHQILPVTKGTRYSIVTWFA
jgi:hypothetical protein